MGKRDIQNRDDIYNLVSQFYGRVRKDDDLGPIFNAVIEDWEAHFEHLTTFWESSLFLQTKYYGDPLKAHIKVDEQTNNQISERHFGIWMNLWFKTIDELFEGDVAQNAKHRAQKMSTFLYLKIFEARLKRK
ncbi:group III truncated hemoglobin [Winogradskyella maritima]|uniref:Group III truncated hemoglobin n=1 Tax=Winogradskyella maritima TaxID=1517766 RepID=A0ABV8AD77_9FLAO|nr:group III truncated hemoglobin [Winogradskyella maritima]